MAKRICPVKDTGKPDDEIEEEHARKKKVESEHDPVVRFAAISSALTSAGRFIYEIFRP
jgi:hypothetical protein